MDTVKCVLVGDGVVGKSCIIQTYITNKYQHCFGADVIEHHSTSVLLDGKNYTLNLCTLAGQEDYDQIRPLQYPGTDIFLLCFSVIHHDSFVNVKDRWLPTILYHCPKVPMLLVGAQSDLRNDPSNTPFPNQKNVSPITLQQANQMAKKIGAVKYMECSALTQTGLKELFDEALKIAINHTAQKKNKKKCGCVLL